MKHINKKQDTKIALTGGAAAAEALRQINPDVMPVYPITPQTPIIEGFAKFEAKGKVDTDVITVESEHSAISACVGAVAAGARTVTATSSQGLALMNEILYIASGMRLPMLMLVSARALSAPINIHGDHSDVMGARDTGWVQIFSENAQEVYDNTIIGMKLTEKVHVPTMVIMDGFVTSHSVENLEVLIDRSVRSFVGEFKFNQSLLDVSNPHTFGPVGLPDSYFDFKIEQEAAMDKVFEEYENVADGYGELSGRHYELFEKYHTRDADHVIVAAGATCGTIKDVVDEMREKGKKVGLLKIKMFRPFPYKQIAKALSGAKNISVLDKSMAFGSMPPICSEIVMSAQISNLKSQISSYVYGLGGRDIFAKDIENVFENMIKGKKMKGVQYIA
ncbi:MAG: pyruvate ferredoxin oxidoreductase [Candidatus Moranbacteria bacterium]|nr:pyruvate ferredoxin oxidoreductase [Candidatus Moranbacteria bacterium]